MAVVRLVADFNYISILIRLSSLYEILLVKFDRIDVSLSMFPLHILQPEIKLALSIPTLFA